MIFSISIPFIVFYIGGASILNHQMYALLLICTLFGIAFFSQQKTTNSALFLSALFIYQAMVYYGFYNTILSTTGTLSLATFMLCLVLANFLPKNHLPDYNYTSTVSDSEILLGIVAPITYFIIAALLYYLGLSSKFSLFLLFLIVCLLAILSKNPLQLWYSKNHDHKR